MVDNRILKLKYYYKRKKNCQISLMLNNLFGFFHFLERKTNNSVNMTIEKIQYNDLNDGKKLPHAYERVFVVDFFIQKVYEKSLIFIHSKYRPLVYEVHI